MTRNISGYVVKEAYSAKWLKVFHHESAGGLYFDNFSESSFSTNPKKYSILKLLPKVNTYERRKYEFLLEYPQCSSFFNRWKQASSVFSSTIREYEPIHVSFSNGFAGISKYPLSMLTAFYGMNNSEKWHFAIGAYTYYAQAATFPGPLNSCSVYYVNKCDIWLRVSNFDKLFLSKFITRSQDFISNKFIFIYLIIVK